ncbi:MAB_1171c family putative transporter [Saccharothrix sp. NPDC042600]|uniref:MAB_1171c family putative transporter n=1 Tax=Saccharothrix TaxID=2071 RepID=UPI003406C939|nr:hypothetical protein GCM10017745_47300 [Saccharothrix mutabilis subsp. capreolus]
MGDALRQWGPAVLAWAVLLTRRGGTGARRCLRWVFLGLACSLTAQIPSTAALVSQATGSGDLARLVNHTGMVLTAWAGQEFMARMNGYPRGPRWQAWWAVTGFAVMCLFFAAAPDLRPQSPWVMEYCLAYAAAQSPALTAVVVLGLRHARRAGDRVLRTSLRLVVAGTVLGLLYLANKTILAMSPRLGFEFAPSRTPLAREALPTTAYLLVLVGAALPTALGWLHHYRLHRRLGPLWRALYRAEPAIALDPPRVPDVVVLRNLRLRVYRRVIEIRDGLLALQPYRDPAVTEAAHAEATRSGLTGRARDAAVEAATVTAALRAHATKSVPARSGPVSRGGTDLADDTAFLVAVSRAFRNARRRALSPASDRSRSPRRPSSRTWWG